MWFGGHVRKRSQSTQARLLLGARVKELRLERGWLQRELAANADIGDRSSISEIERGQANPGLETLLSLAAAFEIGLLDLLADLEDLELD